MKIINILFVDPINITYNILPQKSPHNLYQKIMQFQPEVKQALEQLPPADRVVAVALKNIYDKIKVLYQKQTAQIIDIQKQFMGKCRVIEQNMSSVIKGRKINDNQLAKTDEYFVEEQKQQLKQILNASQPIKDYWNDAIKNSILKDQADERDWKILPYLINLSQQISENTMQITFTFSQNTEVQAGSYTRILHLQNGVPTRFTGTGLKITASNSEPLSKGLLFELFEDTSDQAQAFRKFELVTFLINQLIPYSLRFFLGEVFDEEGQQQDEQDEDDQGQEEEDQGSDNSAEKQGQSGRKKN